MQVRKLVLVALLALAVASCGMPVSPFEPRDGALEAPHVVIAEKAGWPDHVYDEWAATSGGALVARTPEELAALWSDPLDGEPPARYLDTSVVLVVGVLEGGACSLRVFTVDLRTGENDVAVYVHAPLRTSTDDCGRRFVTRTLVVAVPAAAIEPGTIDVTVIRPDGDDDVWRVAG